MNFFSASSVFQGELSEAIPVVHASIGGCRIVGRLCVGKALLCCKAYIGVARLLINRTYVLDGPSAQQSPEAVLH